MLNRSSELPIVVAGHSHTVALVGHVEVDAPTLRPAPEREAVYGFYGPSPRLADYWDALAASVTDRVVGLSWKGHEPALFLIEAETPFDFIYNNDPSLGVDEGAYLVPESLVKASYRFSMDELADLIPRLHRSGAEAVALLGSPPPKRDADIRAGIREEPYFRDLIAGLGTSFDQVRVASERLRLKLWRVLQDSLAEIARSNQAIYIPPPATCMDPDGFLLHEYSGGDATHANYAYGAIALTELKRRLNA
jgi:hypothetical protein